MALSMNQLKACQLLAKGYKDRDAYQKIGVSEATFYRWKKAKDFQECLLFFQREELERSATLAAAAGNADELDQSRLDEIELNAQVRELASSTCHLASSLIASTDIEDLSPRMIPSLIKAATDAIACLREGNDRLTGLEGILDELGKIEKEVSAKAIAIASTEPGKAA